MKHLPYVCLLALGSAPAFATGSPATVTGPAPSSLFGNNVELSYAQQSTSGVSGHLNGWQVSATAYLGKSDLFINGLTTVGGDLGNGADAVSLGYRFKNVAAQIDVALTVGSDETYGLALHRALGGGYGAWASYVSNVAGHEVNLTLSKMLTHEISLDLGHTWISRDILANQNQWSLGVRYKF
jgi:hypothetical protein